MEINEKEKGKNSIWKHPPHNRVKHGLLVWSEIFYERNLHRKRARMAPAPVATTIQTHFPLQVCIHARLIKRT